MVRDRRDRTLRRAPPTQGQHRRKRGAAAQPYSRRRAAGRADRGQHHDAPGRRSAPPPRPGQPTPAVAPSPTTTAPRNRPRVASSQPSACGAWARSAVPSCLRHPDLQGRGVGADREAGPVAHGDRRPSSAATRSGSCCVQVHDELAPVVGRGRVDPGGATTRASSSPPPTSRRGRARGRSACGPVRRRSRPGRRRGSARPRGAAGARGRRRPARRCAPAARCRGRPGRRTRRRPPQRRPTRPARPGSSAAGRAPAGRARRRRGRRPGPGAGCRPAAESSRSVRSVIWRSREWQG